MTATKIINCTPHDCHIFDSVHAPKPSLTIPRSASIARVGVLAGDREWLTVDGHEIAVTERGLGAVSGLPAPADGVLYLVSTIVADAATGRRDLVVPGELVRDSNGRPRGCVGLYRPSRSSISLPIRTGGIDQRRPRWLAIARAIEHVELMGTHFGAGPHTKARAKEVRGLPVTYVWDATQQAQAWVIEDRGVWMPDCRGPWLDGFGREVAEADIVPATDWGWELDAPWREIGTVIESSLRWSVYETEEEALKSAAEHGVSRCRALPRCPKARKQLELRGCGAVDDPAARSG